MQNLHFHNEAEEWMHHMRRGDWERAWRISDKALQRRRRVQQTTLPRHLQGVWNGEPLDGKRVLVRCYHGLGDTIQFVRFAPALRQIARSVIVWAQPRLLPLLRTVDGIDRLLPLHDGAPEAARDIDIEIMELPHALRTTLDTLPSNVPYLRLAAKRGKGRDPRLDVGVVWQSGDWDTRRSVAPQLVQQLMQMQDISWKILQRGPALASWPGHLAKIPRVSNIVEEAAELQALDLLITVDTLSAHLAGALGVRTWTLLPAEADWRWMEHRDDTPWYPSMRLFRQPSSGDWHSVIRQVRAALHRITSSNAPTRNGDCCCPAPFGS
jgi:hypothetical protein